MLKGGRLFVALATLGALLAVPCQTLGQVYSYVDEHGVRNFTNIPPKGPVQDLKVTRFPAPSIASGPSHAPVPDANFDSIIKKYASAFQLDPSLIRSMIATESNFNVRAVSPKGARGLMQLMPGTAERVGVRDLFDPEENIRGGVKHLRSLLDMFNNDLSLSLAAYNAGENLVQRVGKVPNIRETRDYVRSVTHRYGKQHVSTQEETYRNSLVFRYLDRNGVLHLSNIPPVSSPETSIAMIAGGASPE